MTTIRDSIEATIRTLVDSLNGGDAAAVAAHYSDDAALLPPDAVRVDGRAGIQDAWQRLIDADVRDVTRECERGADVGRDVDAAAFAHLEGDGSRVDPHHAVVGDELEDRLACTLAR